MFRIATYNIHKGHSLLKGCRLSNLRQGLLELNADIICLQEVQESNRRHIKSIFTHGTSQLSALQKNNYSYVAYGANATYRHGHHGNAILSRYPIKQWTNIDISDHRLEQRGILHAIITHPDLGEVHILCAHFGLFKVSRVRQAEALITHVEQYIPKDVPLIIGGDFNDWNLHVHHLITKRINVIDSIESKNQKQVARTFPVQLPWFKLDRLYTRNLTVLEAQVHTGTQWRRRSDHSPISAFIK